MRLFVETLTSTTLNDENMRFLYEFVLKLPGSDLQKHLHDCVEHSLLTEQQIKEAKTVMFNYVYEVGKSLYERFPEMTFITYHFSRSNYQAITGSKHICFSGKISPGKGPLVLMQVLSEASTLCTRMTPALTSMFQVAGKDYAKF